MTYQDMKMPHFPFYGEGKQEMTKFYFLTFSDTGYGSLEFNQRGVYLSLTKWASWNNHITGNITMTIERMQIHFWSDVFSAIAIVLS